MKGSTELQFHKIPFVIPQVTAMGNKVMNLHLMPHPGSPFRLMEAVKTLFRNNKVQTFQLIISLSLFWSYFNRPAIDRCLWIRTGCCWFCWRALCSLRMWLIFCNEGGEFVFLVPIPMKIWNFRNRGILRGLAVPAPAGIRRPAINTTTVLDDSVALAKKKSISVGTPIRCSLQSPRIDIGVLGQKLGRKNSVDRFE